MHPPKQSSALSESSSAPPSRAGTPNPPDTAPARRPYRAPELVLYGDIRQITRALNSLMGNPDGMMIGPLVLKTGGF